MNYLKYGDKNNKSIVLIHGMATTATVCYERILPFLREYYVILVEVDGHIPRDDSPLVSLADACTDVERYINTELGGKVYCLGGFSMGGTMATEIMARGNVNIDYGFLDAAFLTKMGPVLTKLYTVIFWSAISWLIKGHSVPKFMMDVMMGKDNSAVTDMLYMGVKKKTIYNACQYVYTYSIPEKIKDFSGEVLLIYGSNEPYPRRGAALLKKSFTRLRTKEIEGMGHGQYIMENSKGYAEELLNFLSWR